MNRVAIVGGGISGLACAYFLGLKGVPSRLYEKRSRLGGMIRTSRLEGCLVEGGPDSWLADKAWMLALVKELGIGNQVIGSNDSRRRTFVVRNGRPVALPDSMRLLAPAKPWQAVTTPLYGTATKIRMALEWFRRPVVNRDRSVADFVRDHFGPEAVEYLAQPLVAGVYGSPPESLSAERVLPQFVEYERRYGSILRGTFRHRKNRSSEPLFLTLRDGMGSLIEALEQRIAGTCEIRRDQVQELRRAPDGWRLALRGGSDAAATVVVATPAHEAARLLSAAAPRLAGLLEGIGYTSSVVAALVYAKPGFRHALDGFGMLVPRAEGGSLAACTWVNTKFDHRASEDRILLRGFLSGEAADRAMASEEDLVLRRTNSELERWMGFRSTPAAGRIYRWKRSMPQYAVGHGDLTKELSERLRSLSGLYLAGNGYDGLGIPDCVRRSERAAERIVSSNG